MLLNFHYLVCLNVAFWGACCVLLELWLHHSNKHYTTLLPPGNEAQGETSTGYSTFKPTQLAAASEVVAKSEPAKKGESTGKESGSDGLKSEAVKPENAGKESGSDALKSEPVKAEENVGKGSGSDQETPPQGTQL